MEVDQLKKSNVRFSEDGPDNLKHYSVVNYDITVSGSFHEIVRLLYEIYQIDSIMRVSDFQIDAATDSGSNSDKLSAEIRIAVLAAK